MAVTIENVRFSYCNLFQPQQRQGQAEAKYGTTILIPKSNSQAKAVVDAEVTKAIEAGVNKKWNGVRPPQPAICVHDGDGPRPSDGQPYGEECRGCWVLTATSKKQPFVVDANVQNIINPMEVYSGMWGNVNVNFYAYNNNGKKGIGCSLNGVQKTRDGEPLSGHITAEEAFKPVAATGNFGGNTPGAPAAPVYAPPAAAPVNPITGQPYAPTMPLGF